MARYLTHAPLRCIPPTRIAILFPSNKSNTARKAVFEFCICTGISRAARSSDQGEEPIRSPFSFLEDTGDISARLDSLQES